MMSSTTIAELETRLSKLEQEIREVHELLKAQQAGQPPKDWRSTYGMFAGDDDFGEVIRLGREYRERVNQKSLESLE